MIKDIIRQSIETIPEYCEIKNGTHTWIPHYRWKVRIGEAIRPWKTPTVLVGEICKHCHLRKPNPQYVPPT